MKSIASPISKHLKLLSKNTCSDAIKNTVKTPHCLPQPQQNPNSGNLISNTLLDKFLTGECHSSFQPKFYTIPGTPTTGITPQQSISLPTIITAIRSSHTIPLQPNPFQFDMTAKAALHNTLFLHSLNFDMEQATQSTPNTTLSYGSEFRDINSIATLFQHHPDWNQMKLIITQGVSYPLRDINDNDRLRDIDFHLKRGNHKSTTTPENTKALVTSFAKEVQAQWAIPISPSAIRLIPGASITPLGVATQWSLNHNGDRVIKRRTTHDCTFPGPSGDSCNNRVIKDLIPECKYGHALLRFLHGISSIRARHPTSPIIMTKTDMDAAYRRIHSNITSAVTCITILQEIAYLLTRLPFGSAPAPGFFSVISDSATDLASDLAVDPTWDPMVLQSRFPFLNHEPVLQEPTIPYGQADPLQVHLPPRDIVADNFIDDIFMAGIDIDQNCLRVTHAVPLALECLFNPPSEADATQRAEIINKVKHMAEGLPSEIKTVLGWSINTRTFRVYLTKHKMTDWTIDITNTIHHKQCTKALLETMIGRFNHVGVIIHIARYFLTRLRYRLQQHQHSHKQKLIKLAPWDIQDLVLWKYHITHLHHKGVSINNICFTNPSSTTFSDACEWGLGGFTTQGHAWRYKLPSHLQHRASINLLEFMAAIITVKLSIDHDHHSSQQPHILAYTYNSSAMGWMYHSTFNPVTDAEHDSTARYLANLLLQAEATLYPEHIPGVHNEIADSLSRDFHLNDSQLLHLLYHSQDTAPKLPPKLNLHQPSKTVFPGLYPSWNQFL